MSTSSTIQAGVDTTVVAAQPDKPFGKLPVLRVEVGAAESFIRFKSPAPFGATIEVGVLRLVQSENVTGTVTLRVDLLAKDFQQRSETWKGRPGIVSGPAPATSVTKTNPKKNTVWEFPVALLLQTIASGTPNRGFRVSGVSGPRVIFHSLNSGTRRPRLDVEWSTDTIRPGTLVPSYGAVMRQKWVQTCDYIDRSGTSPLTGIRVRIVGLDHSLVTGALSWYSGDVDTDVPQLDLAQTTFPGLLFDRSASVEMAVRASGRWSEWSDPGTVVLRNKIFHRMLSPGPAPNDYVTEFTPPIYWEVTTANRTQTRYRVVVAEAATPKVLIYDSGETPGAATSHTLPKNVLKDQTRYRVTVYLWDEITNREATPGDPVYAAASANFDVRYTKDQAPANGMVAEQDGNRPWVDVTVMRPTSPDSWTLLRRETRPGKDFTAVLTDVDPSTSFVSPTEWRFRDYTPRPGVEYEYRAAPVVNGQIYEGGPTATVQTNVVGGWLFDPDSEEHIILGGKEFEQSLTDVAGTLQAIGSIDVVRTVQSLTGLTGSFNLMYRDRDGLTWQDQEETAYDFKGRVGDTFRWVIGDLNIPVILGDVDPARPHPESRPDQVLKMLSAKFWQNGEHPFKAVG